jgi:hypothetical protein
MKIAFYDTHAYERDAFEEANQQFSHLVHYLTPQLDLDTAAPASGARRSVQSRLRRWPTSGNSQQESRWQTR